MYSHAVIGGTFDHLHFGHCDLLAQALAKSKKLTIGITKASLTGHKHFSNQIQSYALRYSDVELFIQLNGREKDVQLIPITSLYGSTLQDTSLEAIFVTDHSLSGALKINEERQRLGLSPLEIERCALRTDDTDQVLSSSRIRAGIVNREGFTYATKFSSAITLPDSAKFFFKRPFGKTTSARKLRHSSAPMIVVGDIATRYCMQHQVPFARAYIDGLSKRKAITIAIEPKYQLASHTIPNLPGQISLETVSDLLHNSTVSLQEVVRVSGEEDLITVAAVILLPLGTKVVYGYPYSPPSLRVITITERIKEAFCSQLTI
ncbi:pantetheine-phosphate adenylyltransferase [Candidatus Woesebacteria bacterium]|nr:pantetheine-phosphate adenylyltransferase [Candidatus Woesebacteria bacterium]